MKNGFLRMCSIVLVLVLLVNMLPMSIFAEEYRESLTATPDVSTEAVDTSDAQIVEEIIENRTEFSKEFLLSNGLHMAAVYPDAVHYETDTGWSEIDNTLTAKADGTYTNTAGVWDVSFPQQLTGAKSVVIEKDGYTFSFAMAGELRSGGDVAAVSSVAEMSMTNEEIVETTAETVAGTIAETVPETTAAVVEETVPETTAAVVKETVPETTAVIIEETIPETTAADIEETVPETTAAVVEEAFTPITPGEAGETFALSQMQLSTAAVAPIDTAALRESYEYAEMAPVKLRSRLRYADVYQNTDIIYDLDANTVKESIVIDAYSSTLRGYRYTLNVGDMIPVLEESGQITLYAPDRKTVVMVMPAPYLVDDADAYSSDIQVQLTGSGSSYTLSYILPQQWLAAEDRAWPVILDPIITANLSATNIQDQTVTQNTTYSYTWGHMKVGYDTADGVCQYYIKYDNLPPLTSSDVVVGAALQMYQAAGGTGFVVEAHKVTGAWGSQTITWSNKPAADPTVEDYVITNSENNHVWNITDIVREWYAESNTGLMLKASTQVENANITNFVKFYSSDYQTSLNPVLAIMFRNNNGLESYWDYTASSAGRAGTGYINNFTGNLVWVRDDLGFGGNRMPVSIQHIYNANDVVVPDDWDNPYHTFDNRFGMGSGWRTNYNQLVYQWSQNSSYYVWEDADGTAHYFKYDTATNTYKDEDGLELTLITTGTGNQKYCITDKYNGKSFFDSNGRLTKIQNNQQTPSSIDITYSSDSDLISKITDGAGRIYNFTYTDGLLSRLSYMGTGTTELSYVTYEYDRCQLISAREKDGNTSVYTYNFWGLMTVVEDSGYMLSYSYISPTETEKWKPFRVGYVSIIHDVYDGGTLDIEYAHNQTTFTDYNGNVEIHQFNNFGNTISIQDDEGHAQYSQYARNTDDQTSKTNQLTLSSKLQNTVGNRIKDSSFENGTVWTPHGSNVTTSVTTETAYYGNRSQKIVNAAYAKNSTAFSPNFYVGAGETVTVSAYIKNPDAATTLEVHYYDSDAAGYFDVRSPSISASNNWTRAEVTFTNPKTTALYVYIHLRVENPGTYYVDCVQVEKAVTASRYNLIENGDFRNGSYGWSYDSLTGTDGVITTTAPTTATELDNSVVQLTGNPSTVKHVYQKVQVGGSAGDSFVLSGWAKGDSVPLTDEDGAAKARDFGLYLCFNNTDGSRQLEYFHFNPDTDSANSWQYGAWVAVAEKAYSSVNIDIRYDYNANTAYFDGIQLFKEAFGTSYTYDADGNVKSVTDLQKQTTTYEYSNNNLTKVIQNGKAKLTYTYDSYHNVKTATTEEGLVYNFTYDGYGNNTSVSITNGTRTMTSTATYSTDGNRLETTKDALDKVTTYNYNIDTNVLEWVKYPEDTDATRTNYSYDSMYRLAQAACTTDTGKNLSATYTYNSSDLLYCIETPSTAYYFGYGPFDKPTSVSTGGTHLAHYMYDMESVNGEQDDRKYDLDMLQYGNGDYIRYTYDDKGRLLTQTYEDGDTVSYAYDNNGALARMTDSATGITTTYYYDFTDRMMKYTESGTGYSHTVGYEYDTLNNLTQLVETINGSDHTTSYTYDDDNRVKSVTTDGVTVEYTYDNFGRVSQQVTKNGETTILTETFAYVNPADGKTSTQVRTHSMNADNWWSTASYTYDDNGNILCIDAQDMFYGFNVWYQYDSANQLIQEDSEHTFFKTKWVYDSAGNIVERIVEDYMTGDGTPQTVGTYNYESYILNDALSDYNDTHIDNDSIGNTLNDEKWSYTWEHGRELVRASDGTTTWTYEYNADGMRTKKTNGTDTYTYIYNGSQLTQMTKGTDTLYFTYDAAGSPVSVKLNDTVYYYHTNIQGDVVAILGDDEFVYATYIYDAWGNILSITDNTPDGIGVLNPLLYRGYVYDQETELYYLQSRYYDPEIGRFISADAFVATGQGFVGNNMFAYCNNNPVNMVDAEGTEPISISACVALVALIACAVFTIISPQFQQDLNVIITDISHQFYMGIEAVATVIAATDQTLSVPKDEIKEEVAVAVVPSEPDERAYFTYNPYDFRPNLLVPVSYPGSRNGRIIKWIDPVSRVAIFEWNEDFKNGSHYHVMKVEWQGNHYGLHFLPGTPVPEPWNSLYFGSGI